MNFKRIASFAIVLVILLILYYLLESPRRARRLEEPETLFPGFDTQQAAFIMITSPAQGKTTLQRENGTWSVTAGSDNRTYPADSAPVEKLLDTVVQLKAETVASRNPKMFEALEVAAGKGVEVIIEDASRKTLTHFYVGKSGPDIFSTYVRAADTDRAILSGSILKTVFEKELKDWRDKTIFALNKDDIIEFTAEGDRSLHLKKDEQGAWQVVAPEAFRANQEAAGNAVAQFADLSGADFAEGAPGEFQLDKPARVIRARLKDGGTHELMIGKEKNTYQRFCTASGTETIFILENYRLEKMCPELEKLKPATQEAKPPDNATDNMTDTAAP